MLAPHSIRAFKRSPVFQDMLFERNWTDAKLSSLVDDVVAPHVGRSSKRIRARGPDIDIGPKFAIALALGLNELVTNAMKYGALSNDAGYVEIAWTEATEVRLRWHERQGPSVAPPSSKGFGSQLIADSMATQFNGKVEFEFKPDGLICTMCFPPQELKR
jgi:two-component sensor histidine kinase